MPACYGQNSYEDSTRQQSSTSVTGHVTEACPPRGEMLMATCLERNVFPSLVAR